MSRQISSTEVKKHSNKSSTWMIIHNDVYDVTKFLEEHPGGEDTLLEYAGKDGSQAFEDVGHSDDARELMKKYKIGKLPPNEMPPPPAYGFVPHQNKEVIVFPASRYAKCKGKVVDDECVCESTARKRKSSSSSGESNGSNLKWVALALASLLLVGFAVKKYAMKN